MIHPFDKTGTTILSQTAEHFIVITALGSDRPGIVNAITRHVSSCGCNIEDSRLALLGEEFTFIMLLSGSWNAIAQIESTLPVKGAELDLLIVMKRTHSDIPAIMPTKVWIQVELPDSPHIIERFTELFDIHHMNIAELVSKTREVDNQEQLHIQMTAHSPADQLPKDIEKSFHKLCTELNAQGSINILTYPQSEE